MLCNDCSLSRVRSTCAGPEARGEWSESSESSSLSPAWLDLESVVAADSFLGKAAGPVGTILSRAWQETQSHKHANTCLRSLSFRMQKRVSSDSELVGSYRLRPLPNDSSESHRRSGMIDAQSNKTSCWIRIMVQQFGPKRLTIDWN